MNEDIPGVIAPPPLLFAAALLAGLAGDRLRPRRILPHWLARPLGMLFIAAGAGLGRAGYTTLRRAGTNVDPRRPSTSLVTVGPYTRTRNPLYVSMTLLYAGIALLVDALVPFILLPAVLIIMQRGVIGREERYLERRFGDEYRDYKRRVRRWV